MGTLTTAQLISQVKTHLANRDDLTDADIVLVLNLTQMRIARSIEFEELKSVNTGTLPFTATIKDDKYLPYSVLTNTNPREIYSFRVITQDGRSRKLLYKNTRDFDREIPEPEFYARGVPSQYTLWAEKFELWRIADEGYDYEIRMSFWPAPLNEAAPTVTSDFREKDDMLIMLTGSYIYTSLGEYDRAGRLFGIFSDMWRNANYEDKAKPDLDLVNTRVNQTGLSIPRPSPWLDPFNKG